MLMPFIHLQPSSRLGMHSQHTIIAHDNMSLEEMHELLSTSPHNLKLTLHAQESLALSAWDLKLSAWNEACAKSSSEDEELLRKWNEQAWKDYAFLQETSTEFVRRRCTRQNEMQYRLNENFTMQHPRDVYEYIKRRVQLHIVCDTLKNECIETLFFGTHAYQLLLVCDNMDDTVFDIDVSRHIIAFVNPSLPGMFDSMHRNATKAREYVEKFRENIYFGADVHVRESVDGEKIFFATFLSKPFSSINTTTTCPWTRNFVHINLPQAREDMLAWKHDMEKKAADDHIHAKLKEDFMLSDCAEPCDEHCAEPCDGQMSEKMEESGIPECKREETAVCQLCFDSDGFVFPWPCKVCKAPPQVCYSCAWKWVANTSNVQPIDLRF